MIAHVLTRRIKHVLLAIALACAPLKARAAESPSDAARAFDFEFGAWTMHLKRLAKPLSGSTEWIEYEGASVVHKVWGGAANLGEIDVTGPAGRIQGMSLRLYEPATGQWHVRFANARTGELGQPMIGGFKDGRGEFYNQETFDGRPVFVRFVFSDITPAAFRLEQAFSADGGRTWEANWIATFRKVG
jgi:hypothetical protein